MPEISASYVLCMSVILVHVSTYDLLDLNHEPQSMTDKPPLYSNGPD